MNTSTTQHIILFYILTALYVYFIDLLNEPRPDGSLKHAIFKGLPMFLLVVGAYFKENSSPTFSKYRRNITLGLAWSFIGDIFLVWEVELFLPGLLSFAVAHLFYIAAFGWKRKETGFAVFIAMTASLLYYFIFLPGLHDMVMRVAVAVYLGIIGTMVWRSFGALQVDSRAYSVYAFMGAVVFAISDCIIGMNNFYFATPTLPHFYCIINYFTGQLLICLSVLEYKQIPKSLKRK